MSDPQAEMRHESNLAMFNSVIEAGQNANKAMMLLNGGAAVAMLAFIGNIVNEDAARATHYASTIVPFAIGALMAGLTSGGTYLTQMCYARDWSFKAGIFFHVLTIVVGVAAYGCFIWGLFETYGKLSTLLPP